MTPVRTGKLCCSTADCSTSQCLLPNVVRVAKVTVRLALCAELEGMHAAAQSEAGAKHEEVESLRSLIGRLNYNNFFSEKQDLRALLAAGRI